MTAIPGSNVFGTSVTSMEAAEVMGHSLTHHTPYHGGLSGDALPVATRQAGISAEEEDEGRPVHPSSRELFRKCNGKMNYIRYIPIFGEAIECYGLKLMLALCTTYFFSKGLSYQLISSCTTAMFLYRYNCTAVELNRFNTVTNMGWSIKPFTAMLSDAFAFFGYKKRWIMTISAIFAAVCSIGFGVLPADHSSSVPGAVLAFLVGYGQANIDILSEGLYSRRMRQFPKAGPALVSCVWVVQMVGTIIGSLVVGPLTDANIEQVSLYVCGACMFVCFPFFLFNWLMEGKNRIERHNDAIMIRHDEKDYQKRKGNTGAGGDTAEANRREPILDNDSLSKESENSCSEDVQRNLNSSPAPNFDDEEEEELHIPTYCGGAIEFNKEVLVRNWRITVYSIVMTAVVVVTAIVTLLYGTYPLLATSLAGSLILSGMMFWSLPIVVAKAGLFGFLNQAFYVKISGALQAFYLAGEECNPGGPHFSYFFYNTIFGVVGSFACILGIVGFAYLFSKRSYRFTFFVTLIADIVAAVFDLIIVMRWNLPAIPDHYMYVFGDAVVFEVAYMLNAMPYYVLLSQLCPRGSEAMVYALLAAFSNYGTTIASIIGTLLMEYVWPVPADLNTNVCNFDNLWKLIVFGHMGLPALIVLSVFILIPSARICDELDAETGKAVVRGKTGMADCAEEEGGEAEQREREREGEKPIAGWMETAEGEDPSSTEEASPLPRAA